mmetsp:Transcript_38166/g.92743  ORF Transcript_38166/g.92743 Transcript_38166/m.92743 type:complete len:84 (-) Transcript_38166:71-322(-)
MIRMPTGLVLANARIGKRLLCSLKFTLDSDLRLFVLRALLPGVGRSFIKSGTRVLGFSRKRPRTNQMYLLVAKLLSYKVVRNE